jgi:ribosome-associated protein
MDGAASIAPYPVRSPPQNKRTNVENPSGGSETAPTTRSDRALERALVAARTAEDNRGRNITILDVRELTTFFDYFVVVSGASRRQLHAISEEIDHALEDGMGDQRLGIEGYQESRWILLDYGDVVIHIFEPETRAYYALEELWGHAKQVPFESRLPDSPAVS